MGLYTGLLSDAAPTRPLGELIGSLRSVAGTLDTDLSPLVALKLANRLSRLDPDDIRLFVIDGDGELETGLQPFREGR